MKVRFESKRKRVNSKDSAWAVALKKLVDFGFSIGPLPKRGMYGEDVYVEGFEKEYITLEDLVIDLEKLKSSRGDSRPLYVLNVSTDPIEVAVFNEHEDCWEENL